MNMHEDLLNKLEDIFDIANEVEQEFQLCKQKTSIVDKMVVDLEHKLELEKLDAIGYSKLMKEFKATLKLRRYYKDRVNYLILFRNSFSINEVDDTRKNIIDLEEQKEKRKYKIRVKEEVKQEILKEIELIKEG